MSKAMRAQARVERAARAVGCTQESIEWMESALDPFPDQERKIAGYPDMISGKSVVQAYRQKTTVNGPGSGNWDCQISFDGMFASLPCYSNTFSGPIFTVAGQGATPYNVGGIQVRWAASGTNLYLPTVQNGSCMTPIMPFTSPYRVIGMAVEIWNTTAPLYRQGNVVVWRQPRQAGDSGSLIPSTATPVYGSSKIFNVATIPETPTNALILQGAQSWAAEKGVYMVGTLCQQEVPLQEADFTTLYAGQIYTSNSLYYISPISLANAVYPYINQNPQDTSFNQFGAYFTGLSQQTTLDVVWHYIVERFPYATNVDLVTMASNSCPYDPKALELYSKTIYHLPAGVWVEENGLGDWICEVADTLSTFGVPGMGIVKGVTKAIQGVSNAFDNHQGGAGKIVPEQQQVATQASAMNHEEKRHLKQAQQAQRIGPRLPTGKFKSEKAKTQKKKKKNKRKNG